MKIYSAGVGVEYISTMREQTNKELYKEKYLIFGKIKKFLVLGPVLGFLKCCLHE